MDSLREKVDVLLETLQIENEYCSFTELQSRVVFGDNLSKEEKFKAVLNMACKHCINTKDRFWVAKLYGGGSEASFLAEMIIAYYNQNCHTYSSSPFFTFAEEQILKKIIGYVGYGDAAKGIFLPGGSYCTLNAMICARFSKYPHSKQSGVGHSIQVITSINSHYSIEKSANMMGVGVENVLKIDFEETTARQLEEIILNNNVFMINSTFGTTCHGTMESLDKYSKVLKKHKVWHHIDACVGGVALFSTKYRYLTDAFQDADSITIDAHKCLNLNQQCSMLLLKEGRLLGENSSVVAPYLFHQDDEYDISHRSLQCGRRGDGFKLWFCDQIDDLDAQATMIYDRTVLMKEKLHSDDRFEHVLQHSLTHVCFKLKSDKPVDIHTITEKLREENLFVEYHEDYFRLIFVNQCVTEHEFKYILDRISAVHACMNGEI